MRRGASASGARCVASPADARYLKSLGYGLCAEPISAERLRDFLDRLPHFESRLAGYSQDGNRSLFEKLEETIALAGGK